MQLYLFSLDQNMLKFLKNMPVSADIWSILLDQVVKWFFFRLDLVWNLTHMEPLAPNCQAQNCASHAPPTPQRCVKPKNPTCRQYDANFFNLPQGGFRPILDIVQRYVGLQGCMWQPKPISRGKAPFSQPLLVVLLGALHCNLYQGHTLGHKSHSLLKRKKTANK